MSRPITIRRDTPWYSLLDRTLEMTPPDRRKIFVIRENELTELEMRNAERERRQNCYEEMIGLLNDIKDRELRFLLRNVWKKYEDKLRVNNYEIDGDESYFEENANGEWGIYINLRHDITGEDWLAAYHTIFHEFFHNIHKKAGLENTDIMEQFAKTIKSDVQNLLEVEKGRKNGKKLLHQITFVEKKRNKAALYDIIGAVLYGGKYGCNPNDSEIYNKNCKYKYLCNRSMMDNSVARNCSHKIEACDSNECEYRDNPCNRDRKCALICGNKDKGCIGNFQIKCNMSTNDWCDEIFGHTSDYWKKEDPAKFLNLLAEEAFVHMAAEAIVNNDAYNLISECLHDSEPKFREILYEISPKIFIL